MSDSSSAPERSSDAEDSESEQGFQEEAEAKKYNSNQIVHFMLCSTYTYVCTLP